MEDWKITRKNVENLERKLSDKNDPYNSRSSSRRRVETRRDEKI